MAEYKTKYGISDEVWCIRETNHQIQVKCLTCNQNGTITVHGEEFVCPKCHGASKHRKYVGNRHYVDECSTVGQVRIEHTDEKYCYSPEKESYIVQYMLKDTGVNSGTLWNEKDLFLTREEAQAECDRRNPVSYRDEIESKDN